MADSPQQHEVRFPGNASPVADAPWNDFPPLPQSVPPYYPLPVPGQPHGYAGVVPDGVVSIGVAVISHSRGAYLLFAILVPTSECCW
jgi:hypothetical protein